MKCQMGQKKKNPNFLCGNVWEIWSEIVEDVVSYILIRLGDIRKGKIEYEMKKGILKNEGERKVVFIKKKREGN